jgi:hypothetical protein
MILVRTDHPYLRVGRHNPALCELLNENVGFSVNPNLSIKILCLMCSLYLLAFLLLFNFLLSLACDRSSLLSYPLVVLILFIVNLVAP